MDIKNISKNNLIDTIESIIDYNLPLVSNLSNISRILYDAFLNTNWSGFYICFDNKDSMYLGPFQGPIACTEIPFNKGVCGTAVTKKKTMIVPNVHEFPGHIACSTTTNSEIVVPIIKGTKIVGVIDLDSNQLNNYTIEDAHLLEEIASIISNLF